MIINVLANPTTKAQITGDKLPNGSKIGVTLIATVASDGKYDSHEYKNIYYSTTDGATWEIDNSKSILLSATDGTVYAYYPYNTDVSNIENISINATDGTDYMYAEPVSGIKNSNAAAQLTMKHALSVVKFTIQKATSNGYTGAGVISNVKLEGATMGNEGYMNIKTQAVTASAGAMTYTSQLKLNPANESEKNQAQVFAVPTGTQSGIKFTVTMDGQDYTATTGSVTLVSGQQYSYTLNMSSTGLTVNTVTVTEWGNAPATEPMDTQLATLTDGVYAIKADGTLVAAADATEDSYAGVGFVLNGKAYQVSKYDGGWDYWQQNDPTNISGLEDYSTVDGTNESGCLGGTSTPQLSQNPSTWNDGALGDFNGQANTAAILAAQNDGTDYGTIGKIVMTSRNNNMEGHNDWFVPACGELAYMYLMRTELNALLGKVSDGVAFCSSFEIYWSSSESNSSKAWSVNFYDGSVWSYVKYGEYATSRLVRAI